MEIRSKLVTQNVIFIIFIEISIGIRIEDGELSVHRLDVEDDSLDLQNLRIYEIKVNQKHY
jgi:hypothetical protein